MLAAQAVISIHKLQTAPSCLFFWATSTWIKTTRTHRTHVIHTHG